MEGITRQLKFFSRKDRDEFSDVDLRVSLQAALDLLAPNLQTLDLDLDIAEPSQPLITRGNSLRIEQVMTNLLRNALDAVEDQTAPKIDVRFGADQDTVWFEVADNGHGLGDATLADLREPFVTTRESGQGMGLGLAISAGIVEDHDGQMSARNRTTKGAVFRVKLPRPNSEQGRAA